MFFCARVVALFVDGACAFQVYTLDIFLITPELGRDRGESETGKRTVGTSLSGYEEKTKIVTALRVIQVEYRQRKHKGKGDKREKEVERTGGNRTETTRVKTCKCDRHKEHRKLIPSPPTNKQHHRILPQITVTSRGGARKSGLTKTR